MTKQELKQTLLTKGLKCEDLDDIVHDAASLIASRANNSGTGLSDDAAHDAASVLASNANNDGLDAQIDFLMDKCEWSAEDILNQI